MMPALGENHSRAVLFEEGAYSKNELHSSGFQFEYAFKKGSLVVYWCMHRFFCNDELCGRRNVGVTNFTKSLRVAHSTSEYFIISHRYFFHDIFVIPVIFQ